MNTTRVASTLGLSLFAPLAAALVATPALAATPAWGDDLPTQLGMCHVTPAGEVSIEDRSYTAVEFAQLIGVDGAYGPGSFAKADDGTLRIVMSPDGDPQSVCTDLYSRYQKLAAAQQAWSCVYTDGSRATDSRLLTSAQTDKIAKAGHAVVPVGSVVDPGESGCSALLDVLAGPGKPYDEPDESTGPGESQPTTLAPKPDTKPGRGIPAKTGDDSVPLAPIAVVALGAAGLAVVGRRR